MAGTASFKPKVNSAKELIHYMSSNGIELVDLGFTDAFGRTYRCSYAADEMSEHNFKEGFAFDGSSVPLFTSIEHSDMIMKPDLSTCWIDPFRSLKVLFIGCDIFLPNGEKFADCPRNMAKKAVEHMNSLNYGDKAIFGPEAEFFLFENVRYKSDSHNCGYQVDASEGYWNSNRDADGPMKLESNNLAHRHSKGWYLGETPNERMLHIRDEMLATMMKIGIQVEKHHHEVGANQHEIGYRCAELVECADIMMAYKYVVKNVAKKHNITATFMPKPLYGECGSGMHCHQSLWKDDSNVFYDATNDLGLSDIAYFYIGGILRHGKSILAFTNPTVNSYKRLVPGYEAPVALAYSKGNRSAAIRIPDYDQQSMRAKRIEFRCPDGASCPYLAFAAMLQAGLDGIKNRIKPPAKVESSLYASIDPSIEMTPKSLSVALESLEKDHEFLLAGGVFTKSFIDGYIKKKYEEVRACEVVPHPKEYELYYSC